MSITLYTNPMSRGRIARWMLEECGTAYETVVLDYGTTMKAPNYLAINPMGKVPAIQDGGAVVTEVAAICLWLADRFPDKKLAPALNTPERAEYYRWIAFVAGPFESVITAKSEGHFAKPMSAGYGTLDDVIRTIEAAVTGRKHLCGDHFTAADLLLSAYLSFYTMWKLLEPNPVFAAYYEPHIARAARVRADGIDEKLIQQSQQDQTQGQKQGE